MIHFENIGIRLADVDAIAEPGWDPKTAPEPVITGLGVGWCGSNVGTMSRIKSHVTCEECIVLANIRTRHNRAVFRRAVWP